MIQWEFTPYITLNENLKKILFIQLKYAPILFMNKIANFTATETNWSLATT